MKTVNDLTLDNGDVFIVYGDGPHVKEILAGSHKESAIFVLDPDVPSATVEDRLFYVNPKDRVELFAALQNNLVSMSLGCQTFLAPSVLESERKKAIISNYIDWVTDFFHFLRRSTGSAVGLNEAVTENLAYSLYYYTRCSGVGPLRAMFPGKPAIIVSAGPSLSKNVHLLKDAQGKAVIIAVPTIMRTLHKLGIKPDFTCSLDFHGISAEYFKGFDCDVPLVAEPKVAWRVLEAHKGRKFLLDNRFLDLLLTGSGILRQPMRSGATVAHLAFYLAEWMLCDPIIFIGQDLSYPSLNPDEKHMAGLLRTEASKEHLHAIEHTLEKTELKDINGEKVYTDGQMLTYRQHFELDFAASKSTIINATEGGLSLKYTTQMTLAEAIEKYCQETLTPFGKDIEYQCLSTTGVIAVLDKRLEELYDARKRIVVLQGLNKNAIKKVESKAVERVIKRIHKKRDEFVRTYPHILALIELSAQGDALLSMKSLKNIAAKDLPKTEERKLTLEHDRKMLEMNIRMIDRLVDLVKRARNNVKVKGERAC